MARYPIFMTIVIAAGWAASARMAEAQYASPYAPQTPVISPWMGLWQKNTGPLDNYHNYVLPQMELNQTLQMQSDALLRQGNRLQSLRNQITQSQDGQSAMPPTGQGATFMSYSHYYYNFNRQTWGATPLRPNVARTQTNLQPVTGMRQ